MEFLIPAIQVVTFIITIAVFADIIVSFFLSPFHPIRRFLDSFVEPMLRPIRGILPSVRGFDFSPLILLLAIQLAEDLLIALLRGIA